MCAQSLGSLPVAAPHGGLRGSLRPAPRSRGQSRTVLLSLPNPTQRALLRVNPPRVPWAEGLRSHQALLLEVGFSEPPPRMIQLKGLSQLPWDLENHICGSLLLCSAGCELSLLLGTTPSHSIECSPHTALPAPETHTLASH